MRLFFAIPVAGAARDALAALQAKLIETRAQVSWVSPAKFHLTVKFLGETDESFVPELAARLDRAAGQVPQFPIDLDGLSHFPERGPPRTIVAHAFSPDHRLTRLHRLIDSAVGGIGLPMDTRELTPHVTLGRVRSNHGVNRLIRLIDKHEADFLGTFTAEAVSLFLSTQTPEGTVHRALHTAALQVAQAADSPVK
jgi:2'-5' RNA ligase